MIEEKVLTLAEMLKKNAEDKPHKTALIYRDLKYSYEDLNDLVSRLANRLVTLGVEKGDRIGLMLKREPHLIITFLASIKIGAIPCPINYNLPPEQLAGLLSTMKPSLIFTRKEFLELIPNVGGKENFSLALIDERKYPHFYWED
ncbi:AMP-binding protein, partial [bacterium]|nr:AMP-binding protein [bacterium]